MVKGMGNPILTPITFRCLLYPLHILETLFCIIVFLGGVLNPPKMYSLSLFPILSINSLKGFIIGIESFLTVFVLFSVFCLTNEIISSSISQHAISPYSILFKISIDILLYIAIPDPQMDRTRPMHKLYPKMIRKWSNSNWSYKQTEYCWSKWKQHGTF